MCLLKCLLAVNFAGEQEGNENDQNKKQPKDESTLNELPADEDNEHDENEEDVNKNDDKHDINDEKEDKDNEIPDDLDFSEAEYEDEQNLGLFLNSVIYDFMFLLNVASLGFSLF